jgi:hypothetical protein
VRDPAVPYQDNAYATNPAFWPTKQGSQPGLDIQDGLSTCKGRGLFTGLPHWLDKSFIVPAVELESGLHCDAETRV